MGLIYSLPVLVVAAGAVAALSGYRPTLQYFQRTDMSMVITLLIIFYITASLLYHHFYQQPDEYGYGAIGGIRGRLWA